MTDTRSIIADFFSRLGAQDPEGVAALFAEDIDWFVPGPEGLPWTGHRNRREQVPEYFHTMWSHFNLDQSRAHLDQLIVDADDAVAIGTFSHVSATTGRPFSTPFAMHLRVKDGAIVRVQLYEDTYVVAKAFDM